MARDSITRPSGRGKKSEVVSRLFIESGLLLAKQHHILSMIIYQSALLPVEASKLTFSGEVPDQLLWRLKWSDDSQIIQKIMKTRHQRQRFAIDAFATSSSGPLPFALAEVVSELLMG